MLNILKANLSILSDFFFQSLGFGTLGNLNIMSIWKWIEKHKNFCSQKLKLSYLYLSLPCFTNPTHCKLYNFYVLKPTNNVMLYDTNWTRKSCFSMILCCTCFCYIICNKTCLLIYKREFFFHVKIL